MPSISQIAGVPSSFCHRMSDLPSPLKSPVPLICQLGPGLNRAGGAPVIAFVPSISQIAGVPSSFCHRMSDLPSPLKSPVSLICQLGPGLTSRAAPTDQRSCRPSARSPACHCSFCHRMSDLPSPLKSPAVLDVPARPRIERADAHLGHRVRAVHQPDRRRAVVVLPQEVAVAIAVEVVRSLAE